MSNRKQSLSSDKHPKSKQFLTCSGISKTGISVSDSTNPEQTSPLQDSSYPAIQIAEAIIEAAIEQKGLDVRGLDLRGVSDIADHFVIISGTSERHVKGIADKIRRSLCEIGEKPLSLDGFDGGEWILLDYGNVVAHVFYEPTRQYYEFDELWKDAASLPLGPDLAQQVRRLRTGVFG